ncbi:MAG: hypothetical protein ABEH59_06700, partial [Halobacteriales archaeon]
MVHRADSELTNGGLAAAERSVSTKGSRAQTTIDFLIGMGVFLLVVGFVLGVIPSMVDPFSDSQETTIVADRIATQISEGMLADPDRPTVLNQTCVNEFFNESLASGADCPVPFDATEEDLATRLGVQDRQSINVTIKRDLDNPPDGQLDQLATDGEKVSASGSTTLAAGPPVPTGRSIVAASRTAFLDGK